MLRKVESFERPLAPLVHRDVTSGVDLYLNRQTFQNVLRLERKDSPAKLRINNTRQGQLFVKLFK